MNGTFSQRVWELATQIPEGRVVTYGMLAERAGGGPLAARSITSILSKSPHRNVIPWHRIVYANGKVWCPPEEVQRRMKLYAREGIRITSKGYIEDFDEMLYFFE